MTGNEANHKYSPMFKKAFIRIHLVTLVFAISGTVFLFSGIGLLKEVGKKPGYYNLPPLCSVLCSVRRMADTECCGNDFQNRPDNSYGNDFFRNNCVV